MCIHMGGALEAVLVPDSASVCACIYRCFWECRGLLKLKLTVPAKVRI